MDQTSDTGGADNPSARREDASASGANAKASAAGTTASAAEATDDAAGTTDSAAEATDDAAGASDGAADETYNQADQAELRKIFLRDAAVFHGKLLLDGFRDVILFPAALIAAAVDAIKRDETPGKHFYDVVHFGKQTEQWIDLFEAVDRAPESAQPRPTINGPSLDDLVSDLESKLRSGYEKGEVSASARQAIEELIEAARRAAKRTTQRD